MAASELVRIIMNPRSGRGRAQPFLDALAWHLRTRRFRVEVCCTQTPHEGRALAAATPDDAVCVVSIGGDGTHREVIGGLLGRPVAVCVVPFGTENVLAKTFRLTGTLKDTLAMIQAGRTQVLDVGMADSRPFVMFSGIGFDAAVTGLVHAGRRGPIIRANYYWPIAYMWWKYDLPPVKVTVDGRVLCEDAGQVLIGNTSLYAARLRPCLKAVPDDGLLDVACFRTRSRWGLLGHLCWVALGRHVGRPWTAYAQGKHVEIRCDKTAVPVQVDGDMVATTPMTYRVRPKAVRLLVPPE